MFTAQASELAGRSLSLSDLTDLPLPSESMQKPIDKLIQRVIDLLKRIQRARWQAAHPAEARKSAHITAALLASTANWKAGARSAGPVGNDGGDIEALARSVGFSMDAPNHNGSGDGPDAV